MNPHRRPDPEAREPRPSGGGGWLWIAVFAVLAALLGWLASEYGDDFEWGSDGPRLAYVLLLLVLVVSSLALRRTRIGFALKSLLAWAAIGLVIVVGYSYRAELKAVWYRVAGELDTSRPTPVETRADRRTDDGDRDSGRGEGRALAIRQSADGHYYVAARVNGTEVRLLIDTGATLTVLGKRQAERAGIFPTAGEYVADVRTASGIAKAAPVRLRDLEIGEARLRNVRALVMDTPGNVSVLGIDTLQQFKSYEFRDGVLTLRW
ncbi:MAG: TIGR02281 family clan AA aspartic protease [Candidatus Odyssella sp.]|nr:TIGR02281 family clan AA aspartic protease [Candidatus Odyssella sp.]